MYSPHVLEHFERPRNVGDIEAASATAELQNPACGDVMRLSLRVQDGRVVEARYRAKGCVPAIACGSCITELVQGRSLADVRQLRREDLLRVLGGLPKASHHASQLAIDVLAAALKALG